MKRILVITLALIFLCLTALAEIDLDDMTVEELSDLHIRVMEAIKEKSGIKSIDMPPGTYEAGVDFPSGSYSFKNTSTNEFSFASITTYTSRRAMQIYTRQIEVDDLDYIKNAASLQAFIVEPGETLNLKLEEGMLVIATGANFELTPFAGLIINTK